MIRTLSDGAKQHYAPIFARDALLPVNSFGSVSMYDGSTQLLIKSFRRSCCRARGVGVRQC